MDAKQNTIGLMFINLPTRLSVITFRTEHKTTYLHMTLGNVPKDIQLNTKEKKQDKVHPNISLHLNLDKEFQITFMKFHSNKTYNGKKQCLPLKVSACLRKAEQISCFKLLEEHLGLELQV